MGFLDDIRHFFARMARERALVVGAAVSVAWLALAGLFSTIGSGEQGQGVSDWLIWMVGLFMPLALIWLAVWSARSLLLLRQEAADLRAMLVQVRRDDLSPLAAQGAGGLSEPPRNARTGHGGAGHGGIGHGGIDHGADARPDARAPASAASAAAPRRAPVAPATPLSAAPRISADSRQAMLELDSPAATRLTATELFYALNFPDGPEDREAIRCLRLALSDPGMARLIRAAQDVVTLLAAQGIYMDEMAATMGETDPEQWRRFADGARGRAVAGLAVIQDADALRNAAGMMRGDEVFRDVAHHFLRHFDRLMNQKAQDSDPQLLAVLAETRSGRAFILLAQVTGMLAHDTEDETTSEGALHDGSIA